MAAASIGQVHRIGLKTGEMGVMKIQYPGVDKALRSEMAILKRVLSTISMVYVGEIAVDLIVDEVTNLLLQEVNYQLELGYINEFHHLLKDQNHLIIPKPFPQYSTSKVISMSLEEGKKIKEIESLATQEQRNFFGKLIFELYLKEVYDFNLVQTDPNFGNYLFRVGPDPQLVLLDFGACKRYSRSMIEDYKIFVLAIRDQDKNKFFELSNHLGFLKSSESVETKELFWEMNSDFCQLFYHRQLLCHL